MDTHVQRTGHSCFLRAHQALTKFRRSHPTSILAVISFAFMALLLAFTSQMVVLFKHAAPEESAGIALTVSLGCLLALAHALLVWQAFELGKESALAQPRLPDERKGAK